MRRVSRQSGLPAAPAIPQRRGMGAWGDVITAGLLVSLRLAPTLAFAQPFTLIRVPVTVRVLMAMGLSLWLVDARPALTVDRLADASLPGLVAGELGIGISIALALQLAFAAILFAGRTLDIQAGFGLASLADPTTQNDQPLIGAILAYAAGAIFFTIGAQYDLLALWVGSLELLPVGYGILRPDLAAVGNFASAVFLVGVGLVGAALLAIFLADIVIAFMSRTLPQMNMLLLGFQVKSIVLLLVLPVSLALSSAAFLRLLRMALAAPPTFWGVA